MAKAVECAKIDPTSGCDYVVRGETEEDLLRNVALHAKDHGIPDVTPELMDKVKVNIHDA